MVKEGTEDIHRIHYRRGKEDNEMGSTACWDLRKSLRKGAKEE
jgi:hypothetical protein